MKKEFDIKSNFLMIIFCVTLALFIIIFIVSGRLLYQTEYQNYTENVGRRLENTKNYIDRVLNSVVDRSSNISKNLLLQSMLLTEESSSKFLEEYMFLDKFFDGFKEFENYVDGQIRIYTTNENFPENAYVSHMGDLESEDIWQDIKRLKKNDILWETFLNERKPYISVFRRIDRGRIFMGYLEIKTPISRLTGIIDSTETAPSEKISIVTPEGKLLFGEQTEEKRGSLYFERKLITGHKIVLTANKGYVYHNYYIYIGILALLLIVLLITFYLLYRVIINKLTGHFHNFVETIENDDNILRNPSLIDAEGDKDTLKIKRKFKELAQRLNQMYQDLERMTLEKKKVELEYLQSRINPHLLYNSLSVMKWRMYESNDKDMMKLIDLMVEYYRSVLTYGKNIITVKEEIALIKRYLQVVKIAYDKEFDLKIKMSDEVSDLYIIKQILQPVAENAVMHGINDVEGAKIEIEAYLKDNKIILKVEDNGCGMEPDIIEKILNGKYTEHTRRHSGFGLKNTIDRIKMYYGDDFGLAIESTPGHGTCVTVAAEALDKETLFEKM